MNTINLDLEIMARRLDYWFDKVESCYKEKVEKSMNQFRKEIGIQKNK